MGIARTGWVPAQRLSAGLVAIAMAAALAAGCATTAEHAAPAAPQVEVKAFAIPAVGEINPVFVAVKCAQPCPSGLAVAEEDMRAVGAAGNSAQPLEFNAAAKAAGGAVALAPALTTTADIQTISGILGESFMVGAQLGGPYGAALTAPAGLAVGALYSGYLAANPEELQRTKLLPLTFGRYGSEAYGWVFFPKGAYREIEITVRPSEASETGTERAQPAKITVPWTELSPTAAGELRHRVERSNIVMAVELPPIEPAPRRAGGQAVGLLKAVDARADPTVAELWEVRESIATQAEALMANELTNRGYAVERIAPGAAPPAPQRSVTITVLSAVRMHTSEAGGAAMRVAIEAGVAGPDGKTIFSRAYVGEVPFTGVVPALTYLRIYVESANAMGQALNDALSLAIAKACSDPAFVAALSG